MAVTFLTYAQRGDFGLDDLDEHKFISLLTDVIEEIKKENKVLNMKQAHIQVRKGPFSGFVRWDICFNKEMVC